MSVLKPTSRSSHLDVTRNYQVSYYGTETGLGHNEPYTLAMSAGRAGWYNPSWRSELLLGTGAVTPLDANLHRFSLSGDGWTVVVVKPSGLITGGMYVKNMLFLQSNYWWTVPSSTQGLNEVLERARRRFYQAYSEATVAFETQQYIAEAKENYRQIRDSTKLIQDKLKKHVEGVEKHGLYAQAKSYYYDLVHKVRGSRIPKSRNAVIRDALRMLSETWLATSFGILPLIQDIRDAVNAHETIIKQEGLWAVKGTAKKEFGLSSEFLPDVYGEGLLLLSASKRLRVIHSVKITGEVSNDISDVSGYIRGFGLTLPKFIPAIYQIIPWSFFIDYFTNLGDYLDARSSGFTRLTWSCESIRSLNEEDVVLSAPNTRPKGGGSQDTLYTLGHEAVHASRKVYTRRVGTALPALVWENRALSSLKRGLNIAALLHLKTRLAN